MNGTATPLGSALHPDSMSTHYGNGMLQPQWPAMISQNSHPATQQTQPQNYSPWPQMQNHGLQNGMAGPVLQQPQNSGFNNMAFVPSQILQDAIRMSAPVGSSQNDDKLLAQVLHDSSRNGQSYKQAIESLHGVNNHAANLWKDYYLEHKPRIDRLVGSLGGSSVKAVKKLSTQKRGTSSTASSQTKRRVSSYQTNRPQKSSGTGRKTINSITAYTPVYDFSMPAPHAEIRVPTPPSRSPTPPTRIVPGTNGNRYTNEDKEYFVKFISWRLKCDASLTKAEICEQLSQKAPHHTQLSWASHWHSRHDLADKILAAAHEELSDGADVVGSDIDAEGSLDEGENPRYDAGSDSSSDADSSSKEESEYHSMHADSEDDDRRHMGEGGSPFTEADFRVVAKYVASVRHWENTTHKDKWVPFSNRYPQRSDKSWAEFYRRNENEVDRLARKYRKRRERRAPAIQSQRGRPTWASQKRKFSSDDDPSDAPRDCRKRFRDDADSDDSNENSS